MHNPTKYIFSCGTAASRASRPNGHRTPSNSSKALCSTPRVRPPRPTHPLPSRPSRPLPPSLLPMPSVALGLDPPSGRAPSPGRREFPASPLPFPRSPLPPPPPLLPLSRDPDLCRLTSSLLPLPILPPLLLLTRPSPITHPAPTRVSRALPFSPPFFKNTAPSQKKSTAAGRRPPHRFPSIFPSRRRSFRAGRSMSRPRSPSPATPRPRSSTPFLSKTGASDRPAARQIFPICSRNSIFKAEGRALFLLLWGVLYVSLLFFRSVFSLFQLICLFSDSDLNFLLLHAYVIMMIRFRIPFCNFLHFHFHFHLRRTGGGGRLGWEGMR